MHIYIVLHTSFCTSMGSVPKKKRVQIVHVMENFKKLNLKVKWCPKAQRETITSRTKFNEVQNIFKLILYSINSNKLWGSLTSLFKKQHFLLKTTANFWSFEDEKVSIYY